MKIILAEERKEVDIAISEIVRDGGILDIQNNVKKYFSIDYKPRKDQLTLVAGGYVGLIPINERLSVDVKPKFSIKNLTYIVSIAEENFQALDFFSRVYRYEGNTSDVVFDFLIKCLITELEKLYEEGVLREYILKTESSSKIKGKIDLNSSIKKLWAQGHFHKAEINFFEMTQDNILNKLIKFTLDFCINSMSFSERNLRQLKNKLTFFYSLFDDVSLPTQLHELRMVSSIIRENKIPVIRDYYHRVCKICLIILKQTGIDFEQEGNDISLNSYVLDMETIFEKYLLNSLKKKISSFKMDIQLLDGNTDGRKSLFNNPQTKNYIAKPDIIVRHQDQNLMIMDAKYKTQVKESDRYQIITHALSYGARIAILVLPKGPDNSEQLIKIGSIGTEFEVDVYEYYFNLSAVDLLEEESMFLSNLNSLM